MQIKKIQFYLIFILFLFPFKGQAQIELKNKIIDLTNMTAIESASIYVKNTTIGTISNADGKFVLHVPREYANDTLIISSIGFKNHILSISEFDSDLEIYLEEDVASLDEIVLIAEKRPQTGNEIVIKAIEELDSNLADSSFIQKGFLRHKERNKIEFKWLIESAITVYDSGYNSNSSKYLKINVDEVRKSYDLRDIDSLFSFASYKNQNSRLARKRLKAKDIKRHYVTTNQLIKAIKWNDRRVNGLQNIFQGKLNFLRNAKQSEGLFNKNNVLDNHLFSLDTILVDNNRKIYKIKINKGKKYVNLKTIGIFNDGYHPEGWLYIYYDNYAFKKIEYNLVAASDAQKIRSKRLFDTQTNHKVVMTYMEYGNKMYPNYIYYETPKLVNVGAKDLANMSDEDKQYYNKEERFYTTIQEILFTKIILDDEIIQQEINNNWNMDIFSPKPFNKTFWKNYNVLLESKEDKQLIEDLTQRATLTLYKD